MMAALIGLPDAQSFVVSGECTVLPYFPTLVGVWGLDKPHTRLTMYRAQPLDSTLVCGQEAKASHNRRRLLQ